MHCRCCLMWVREDVNRYTNRPNKYNFIVVQQCYTFGGYLEPVLFSASYLSDRESLSGIEDTGSEVQILDVVREKPSFRSGPRFRFFWSGHVQFGGALCGHVQIDVTHFIYVQNFPFRWLKITMKHLQLFFFCL